MSKTIPVTARWTAAAHDRLWADAANWTPGAPAAAVVASFMRANTTIDLAAAASLEIGQIALRAGSVTLADGTLLWKSAPYERRVFADVGLRIEGAGSLTVAGNATLYGVQTIVLGDVSGANLDIQGTLTDQQVYAGRGSAPVSITVEGSAARWETTGIDQSFQLGGAAATSLTIQGGGQVSDGDTWANQTASSTMTIGGKTAGATVTVTDAGSLLKFQILDVGGLYSGTLDIAAGAQVIDRGGNVGELGDGTVEVSGAGTKWENLNGLFIAGTVPHGTVSVTDGASVEFGEYGLQLGGDFAIDATARLVGGVIVASGGAFTALASAGAAQSTVTIGQSIELGYNYAAAAANIGSFFGSAAGATLVLSGQVAPSGSAYDPLAVGAGHVVLSNAQNGDFAMALYGGVLEFSTAGASGTGAIAFLDSAGATLQFDQTGTIANAITGFGGEAGETIDLGAVSFDAPPALTLQQGGDHVQRLSVSDGTNVVTLALGGGYKLAGFATADDGHHGTLLTYHR